MNEQMVILLLSFFVLVLAGIVVWQHLAFRSGIRRELLEMAEELKDILDRDSGGGLMIFTNHQGLMALMSQINRLLEKHRKTVPSNYKQHVDTGLVLAEQLKAVGITAEVEQVEWSAWVSDVYRGRQYEATVSGIAADDMTAREMLVRYMTEDRKNFIAFSDPEYDEVLAKALSSIDGEEQTALYQRAEEILNERAASLWLQDMCDLVVMNPALDGFTFYSTYVLDMSTIGYR